MIYLVSKTCIYFYEICHALNVIYVHILTLNELTSKWFVRDYLRQFLFVFFQVIYASCNNVCMTRLRKFLSFRTQKHLACFRSVVYKMNTIFILNGFKNFVLFNMSDVWIWLSLYPIQLNPIDDFVCALYYRTWFVWLAFLFYFLICLFGEVVELVSKCAKIVKLLSKITKKCVRNLCTGPIVKLTT